MGHEPTLIPDATLFIQLAIFLATYLVMRQLVFKPFVALLEAREARTVGLAAKAVEAEAQAEKLRTDYEQFMAAEKKKIAAIHDEEKRKIAEEEARIVGKARDAAAAELESVRATVNKEVEKARAELKGKVSELASQMTGKVLGYAVNIQGGHKEAAVDRSTEAVPG